MKILQVVHGFPPKQRNGTEIYTWYLSRKLAKRHEVHICYPTNGSQKVIHTFEREGLHIHEFVLVTHDNLSGKIRTFWNLLSLENTFLNRKSDEMFETLLKNICPDIIHFQHIIGMSATLINITRKLGIPSVLTLHDFWFLCPNINLLDLNYNICERAKPEKCRNCWIKSQSVSLSNTLYEYYIPMFLSKNLLDIFLKFFNSERKFKHRNDCMKSLLLKVDKIITPSYFSKKIYIKNGIPEDKITYSENGYNLEIFRDFKKKKKESNNIVFGFIGSIRKLKGIHVLVDAFVKVFEGQAELRIYGSCDHNSRFVRELTLKIKKKMDIKWMGRFTNPIDPFSEIDILIVPSICNETGGPLVIREALATNTPVIASNLGCMPELIKDNENGFLFEHSIQNDLYDKIIEIIENPELIEKLKNNMKSPKNIEDQASEIENIYQEVIEQNLR